MKRVSVRYEGYVQGVGFRYSAVSLAAQYPVTGYVQNLSDGKVLLVAEGDETHLLGLLQDIKASHLGQYIRSEDVSWGLGTGEFKTFAVRYGY
ncbi:MAG TPA: acylphosphatase [Verrucomicrobia bacterium]|nr:acylphosphatase [Verrucomicrobiota bacterium]